MSARNTTWAQQPPVFSRAAPAFAAAMESPNPSGAMSRPAACRPEDWSPASRDPRFSADTPAALLARIEDAVPADERSWWVARIIGNMAEKVRKSPIFSRQRKERLKRLVQYTERVEGVAAAKRQREKGHSASPAASLPIAEQETDDSRPQQRARYGGEWSGSVVCALDEYL